MLRTYLFCLLALALFFVQIFAQASEHAQATPDAPKNEYRSCVVTTFIGTVGRKSFEDCLAEAMMM